MAIDIIDEKILEVLQQNGRISISELSKTINLSLSAVSERLKKLESTKVIKQYTAIVNPEEMGITLGAIIFIGTNGVPDADFKKLIDRENAIINCSRVAGEYDFIIKAYVKNQSELTKLLDRFKSIKCVEKVMTTVLLDNYKTNYSVKPVANK